MAKGSKWLSQAIDINDIESGKLNIIQAPTGSGKSYFALNDLTKKASKNSRYLYLIDKRTPKNRLSKSEILLDREHGIQTDRVIANKEIDKLRLENLAYETEHFLEAERDAFECAEYSKKLDKSRGIKI
jgi:ABC-type lipoprotein export system ATPase subunit